MALSNLPIEIPDGERTPLVNWLLNLVAEQQQIIEKQRAVNCPTRTKSQVISTKESTKYCCHITRCSVDLLVCLFLEITLNPIKARDI